MLQGGPIALYERVHDAVIACLKAYSIKAHRGGESDGSSAAKGPFFCFARRHRLDVLVGQDKIAGSAQRRTQQAVLQHGSIILGNRAAAGSIAEGRTAEVHIPQQPSAITNLDVEETVAKLRTDFVQALAKITSQVFKTGQWATHEMQASDLLVAKYASKAWTQRR